MFSTGDFRGPVGGTRWIIKLSLDNSLIIIMEILLKHWNICIDFKETYFEDSKNFTAGAVAL